MSLALHWPFYQNASLTDLASGVALACTRATTRSMPDADGWIREVQANEAAFEGATFRHNLVTQSEDLSTTWSNLNTTDSGTTLTANAGTHVARISNTVTLSAKSTEVYLMSVEATAGTHDYLWLGDRGDAANLHSATFNLATGAIVGTTNLVDSGIIDNGDGSYRCWIAFERVNAGGVSHNMAFGAASHTADNPSATYAGTETLILDKMTAENVSGRWDSDNLLTDSNEFNPSAGDWLLSSTGRLQGWAAGETSPVGSSQEMQQGSDSGTNVKGIAQNIANPVVGDTYRLSVYAKKTGTVNFLALGINDDNSGLNFVWFDFSDGTVGTEDTGLSGNISDEGDGWYRCDVVGKYTTTTLARAWILATLADGSNSLGGQTQGDSLFYISGALFERNKPAQTGAGTYVETTTAAVTNYSPGDYIATTTVAKSVLSGANDGIVDWESRTNIAFPSEDMNDTRWTAGIFGATVNTNQTIAPDGSLTADEIEGSGGGTGNCGIRDAYGFTVDTTYVLSVFAKADALSWLHLDLNGMASQVNTAWYNLVTGAVGTTGADVDASGIEDYGNGWYRCWLTFTTDSVDTVAEIRIQVADADNDATVTRDSTSSIFVWGVQCEVGSQPSPYIRTTTGTVTANGDDISYTNQPGIMNAQQGTFYFRAKSATNESNYILRPTNGSHRFNFSNAVGADLRFLSTTPAAAEVTIDATGVLDGTFFEAVFAYAANDCASFVNGSPDETDVLYDAPDLDFPDLYMGSSVGTNHFNGVIAEVRHYNTRLDDQTSQDMSSGIFPSFSRRVQLTRTLTANLERNLTRNLIN